MIHTSTQKAVIESLFNLTELYPELRIGQLIASALYPNDDLSLISDSKLRSRLEELSSGYMSEPE